MLEVQGNALHPLVALQEARRYVVGRLLLRVLAFRSDERPVAAHGVTLARQLHLDDFSAQPGEVHACVRSGEKARNGDYSDIFEGLHLASKEWVIVSVGLFAGGNTFVVFYTIPIIALERRHKASGRTNCMITSFALNFS